MQPVLCWEVTVPFRCRDHRFQDSLAKERRSAIEVLMLLVKPLTKRFGFGVWEGGSDVSGRLRSWGQE